MSVAILVVWLLVIPVLLGSLAGGYVYKWKKDPVLMWISGQIFLWALFQLICVPFVLARQRFSLVVLCYGGTAGALALLAAVLWIKGSRKRKRGMTVLQGEKEKKGVWYYVLWGIFVLLLLFQLVQTVRMTYGDGDDAFYVAVSSITEESDYMYQKLPYTGGTTALDARHGLAPFPVWIAFLARVSGMRTVSVAHVAVPLALLLMTYGGFYLIGRKLLSGRGERLPFFLVMTELLVLFGDTSFYTVENFMLARSRQGKSAMGSIVFPMMVWILLMILEKLQEGQGVERIWWLLLGSAATAACLCSTLGTMLSCLLVGVTGLCAAAVYRRWKLLIPMAACCIPAVCYVLLYLVL